MKLEIQIQNVVTLQISCYFIAVQIDYHDQTTKTQKFRTDIVPPSNRPKFTRNLFTFNTLVELQTLKFGLMACQDTIEANIKKAKLLGLGSIRLSFQSLKQLSSQGASKQIFFFNKSKEVGQFQCKIRFLANKNKTQNSIIPQQDSPQLFNPLISRVFYSQQASKDELRIQNNIKILQKQSQLLYADFKSVKSEEETLEKILAGLLKDEEQLKSQIQITQKINQKISNKINQREQLQPLTLEIEMLKNTEEGRRLLIQKLQYFESRIGIQELQHNRLALKYEKIKHQLDERIKNAQNYAQKLKGKQMQEFQLKKNKQILKKYDDIEYQFTCNQNIIKNLAKQIPKSELNATQAALLLSQVNFNLQLQKINSNSSENQKILNLIQKEAQTTPTQSYEQNQQERLVLGIKLSALQEEIAAVRTKLRGFLTKKQIQESTVKRI